MADEQKTNLRLEIAHVLFIDIVGYSKLSTDEQSETLHELNAIVRRTETAQTAEAAGQLVFLPTGDGMALVFTGSEEDPVECALEIAQALRAKPSLPVRMGIHSGPVHHVADVNQRENIAGAGINVAQRIMDCGDAGHILVSKRVADDLAQSRRWQPYLHDLGDVEVKHGDIVSLVNFYADVVGNPAPPAKIKGAKATASSLGASPQRSRISIPLLIGGFLLFCLAVVAIIFAPAILKEARSRSATSASPALSSAVIPEKSIAVLPFENLSESKENAFFADGVQDEILTALAKVADLKVISRTSVMQYRNAGARNLREIGQQLGVAHVLEGSVQRAANKIRVNAQLIDARDDAHLWAQTYDRDLADVFAIQSEIAQTIAEQLKAHLSPTEKAAIAEAPTKDLVANDLFRRARVLDDQVNDPGSGPGLLQGISLLEEAVRRDPNFYLAYCLICEINLDIYWGGFDHTPGRRDQALAALKQAERINPDAGEVHMQKADYAYHGFRDYEAARTELELARKSLPNSSRLFVLAGAVDRRQARWDDALRNFDRAVELDPRDLNILQETGSTYGALHRIAQATQLFQQAVNLSPKDPFTRVALLASLPYLERADTDPLRAELNKILAEGKDAASHIAVFSVQCALAEHDHAAALRALDLIPAEGTVDSRYDISWPRDWHVGLVAHCFKDNDAAKKAFASARTAAAKNLSNQPDYAAAWAILGAIDAGLGRKDEAIAEGKRACELLPLSKDAWDGAGLVSYLALIYTWLGEKDLALEQLAIAAKAPNGITYGELKLDPTWDALRGDPRFEKLVTSLTSNKSVGSNP
ncbi:MAG TPA: FlgO family outer membrane protein [Chthoniobacterales bacterium]|jgi:TolB-like protein/class 3 adenylate cyclase/cytochrome c-type biogenesis protein CcmH/NrfG|nr:FlgO family outer membrane protein [Chthoniobacterales bacterium]